MPELYRLVAHTKQGTMEVILTDTHVDLEPSPEYRAFVEDALNKGRTGAQAAPGVIGWIAEKAVNLASRQVERFWEPHPIDQVELLIKHNRITIKAGLINYGTDMDVDPTEAFILDAKFREAREKLSK